MVVFLQLKKWRVDCKIPRRISPRPFQSSICWPLGATRLKSLSMSDLLARLITSTEIFHCRNESLSTNASKCFPARTTLGPSWVSSVRVDRGSRGMCCSSFAGNLLRFFWTSSGKSSSRRERSGEGGTLPPPLL